MMTSPRERDIAVMRCLADMAQATAWLNFTTAQANHEQQRYGEWRCDYAEQAALFQRDYERAGRELLSVAGEPETTDANSTNALRAALLEIVRMDERAMFERCPDCEYDTCSQEERCRVAPRSQIGKVAATALGENHYGK